MRERTRSSAKRVSPVTFAQASTLGRRRPMTESGPSRELATRKAPCSRAGHPTGRELDGIEDLRVPRAAAEVPGERGPDRVPVGTRRRVQQGLRGEEDPRYAVSALRGAELREGLLEGMERAPLGEALDGEDRRVLALDGQRETGEHRLPVQEDRAGPALSELAAMLGPGQREVLAQHLEERPVD